MIEEPSQSFCNFCGSKLKPRLPDDEDRSRWVCFGCGKKVDPDRFPAPPDRAKTYAVNLAPRRKQTL